jgi:hypothetical protein
MRLGEDKIADGARERCGAEVQNALVFEPASTFTKQRLVRMVKTPYPSRQQESEVAAFLGEQTFESPAAQEGEAVFVMVNLLVHKARNPVAASEGGLAEQFNPQPQTFHGITPYKSMKKSNASMASK